jgi:hypothetical protein
MHDGVTDARDTGIAERRVASRNENGRLGGQGVGSNRMANHVMRRGAQKQYEVDKTLVCEAGGAR